MKLLRPSVGFCALVLCYGACFAFFAWGFSTPPLDRVWQLHHELEIGRTRALSVTDQQLLASALRRHPALGEALLGGAHIGVISAQHDGWVESSEITIVRTPRARAERLSVGLPSPPEPRPVRVVLSGAGSEKALPSGGGDAVVFDLPPAPQTPELLTLRLEGGLGWREPGELGVRVRFDPPETEGDAPETEGAVETEGAAASDGEADEP